MFSGKLGQNAGQEYHGIHIFSKVWTFEPQPIPAEQNVGIWDNFYCDRN